ncbi:hypothetical protein LINPERPRIM_LOCUS22607 [Linum perenne]
MSIGRKERVRIGTSWEIEIHVFFTSQPFKDRGEITLLDFKMIMVCG